MNQEVQRARRDEINRLKGENEELRASLKKFSSAKQQIDKLRTALQPQPDAFAAELTGDKALRIIEKLQAPAIIDAENESDAEEAQTLKDKEAADKKANEDKDADDKAKRDARVKAKANKKK